MPPKFKVSPKASLRTSNLTGYLYGNGASNVTASTTIPSTAITGLATVATTGNYNDLLNKPTLNAGTVTSVATSGSVNGITLTGGPITSSGTITLGGTLSGISNSQLTNNSITVTAGAGLSGGGTVALGGTITLNASGGGTVSSVSVSPNSGVTAGVTNSTTTPTISIGLGAITPTSVTTNTMTFGVNTGVLTVTTGTVGSAAITGSGQAVFNSGPSISNPTITGAATAVNLTTSGLESVANLKTSGLTGYLYGNSTTNVTASTTIPTSSLSGTVTNAQLANSAITIAGTSTSLGGSISQDTITGLSTTGIVKRTGANTLAIATSGSDYAPATSTTNILYGNGSGGFSPVTVGSGLTFTAGTLASTSGGGSVTTVSVSPNSGVTAGVTNPTTTPAISIGLGNITPTSDTSVFTGSIGATTPNTGSFTTLAASSTVSGTGFSTYLASPPAIGSSAANTGAFTTLSASGAISSSGSQANNFGAGGTGTGVSLFALNGGSGTNGGSEIAFFKNSIQKAVVGTDSCISGGTSDNLMNYVSSGGIIRNYIGGIGDIGDFTSYGLTLTGVLNATVSGLTTGTIAQFNTLNGSNISSAISLGTYPGYDSLTGTHIRAYTNHGSTTYSSLAFEVNGTSEAMRIDSSGNLLVGNTSAFNPASGRGNITINGSATSILNFGIAGSNTGYIYSFTDGLEMASIGSTYVRFVNNNTERARIDGSGQLLLGTTTPVATGAGSLTVGATTASTSTTTGALTVAGGVGIAGNLNTGTSDASAPVVYNSGGYSYNMLGKILTSSSGNGTAQTLATFTPASYNCTIMIKVVIRGSQAGTSNAWEDVGYASYCRAATSYVSSTATVTNVVNISGTHTLGTLSWLNVSGSNPVLQYKQGSNGFPLETLDVYTTGIDTFGCTFSTAVVHQ